MAQTELRLDGLGIRKIAEIPPDIKVLSISSNRLKNLGSIVECLTLVEVNLAANKLDEAALAPLAALPALRVLNVSRNHVRDLSPLVSAPVLAPQGHAFPALEELNISSNPLSDVTAAMSLQVLRVLTAASLAATALQCVHCSLEVIDLRSCCLQSISGLQALPYLTELILDGNALLSCKDVAVHPSLQALRLSHNAIGDISAVQLPFLTELDLASNSLSQAFNLAGAPRLVSLVLRTNQLTSLGNSGGWRVEKWKAKWMSMAAENDKEGDLSAQSSSRRTSDGSTRSQPTSQDAGSPVGDENPGIEVRQLRIAQGLNLTREE